MGLLMSSMTQAGSTKMFSFALGAVFAEFIHQDNTTFDQFHAAMLDLFTSFNAAMPGRHYDAPRLKDVRELHQKWPGLTEAERRQEFSKFMNKNVKPSRADPATLLAGMVTPPAALAAKKAGENLPQLKMIKHVPDVFFVPAATVIALISVKISRRMYLTKLATE